jgi:hypothetical protein
MVIKKVFRQFIAVRYASRSISEGFAVVRHTKSSGSQRRTRKADSWMKNHQVLFGNNPPSLSSGVIHNI